MTHAKHAKEETNKAKQKQIRFIKVLLVLLLLALAGAAFTIYRDYKARPGFLEKVWVSDRGADYITVAWDRVRNADKYVIMYDGRTVAVSGRKKSAKIKGLTENTQYVFSVRADSKTREGFDVLTASAKTKKFTHIKGEKKQSRFANMPVDLKQTAETEIIYLPGSGYTVTPDGEVTFTRPGKVKVTAKTKETQEYASVSKVITVKVLDTVAVDADGAKPHIFYKLNKKNCECVEKIKGNTKVVYPQSFELYDGKYIVSFIKTDDVQRIITFGKKKKVHVPKTDLGHANGLTIADGRCYSVRGYNNTKCITFDASNPSKDDYDSFNLEYGAAGIAYDPQTNMFYTSSRKRLIAYDSDFNLVNKVKRVNRKSTYYVQDCGAYGGILMQCVSGEDPQGTNYIDFYDMNNSLYLGTVKCQLNEIESLIVDDEGYIELLSIGKKQNNYIWKTPINMKNLCD